MTLRPSWTGRPSPRGSAATSHARSPSSATSGLRRCSSATTPPRTCTSGGSTRPRRRPGSRPATSGSPADTSEADVLALVDELNADDQVDGILVQLPLPAHIDETKVTYAVAPRKDVDGFHPVNAGQPLPRDAAPRARDAGRLHGAPRRVRHRPGGEGGGRHRAQRDRRAARPRCCSCRRTRRSRSATRGRPTSRRRCGAATSSSPPSGVPGIVTPDMVKPGAAVLDVGHDAHGGGDSRRCRPRRRRGRGAT